MRIHTRPTDVLIEVGTVDFEVIELAVVHQTAVPEAIEHTENRAGIHLGEYPIEIAVNLCRWWLDIVTQISKSPPANGQTLTRLGLGLSILGGH